MTIATEAAALQVPFVVKGTTRFGKEQGFRARAKSAPVLVPKVSLNELVWMRQEMTPAYDVPIAEVIDFLVAVGERLDVARNPYLAEALANMAAFSTLDARILENCYRDLHGMFRKEVIIAEIEQALGGPDVLDGWVARNSLLPDTRVRAIPPRMVHILAGNSPLVAAITVLRASITKGVHLLKLPSNDMFTATALLRTMAEVDPAHPTLKSFTAAYWRGGDVALESAIYRAQYFDKIVVWGGAAAVQHVVKYVGPGLEMISFDPKVSASMIGNAAFESEAILRNVARAAAADVIGWNQDACSASRFQFVQGSVEQVDRYCEYLVRAMGVDTRFGPGKSAILPPAEIREQLESLSLLEPLYRLFGKYDGNGLVIRSDEPVSFTPAGKTVNVVRVDDLAEAVQYLTVATQTVGVFPPIARVTLRDRLAGCGVQRIVELGAVNTSGGLGGMPHDGSMPVNRFMRWMSESGSLALTGER